MPDAYNRCPKRRFVFYGLGVSWDFSGKSEAGFIAFSITILIYMVSLREKPKTTGLPDQPSPTRRGLGGDGSRGRPVVLGFSRVNA